MNTIDRYVDILLTFTAAFAQILGTYKEGVKLEKDQNLKKGDKTCSKVWSPGWKDVSAKNTKKVNTLNVSTTKCIHTHWIFCM